MRYLLVGSLTLVGMVVALAADAKKASDVELHLVALKETQLPDEQADFQLTLVNNSGRPVDFERGLLDLGMQIEVDREWIDCRPVLTVCEGVRDELRWQRIEPGKEITLGSGAFGFVCLREATVRGPESGFEWSQVPGSYRLRSTGVHRMPSPDEERRFGPAPEGARAWTLASNAVAVSVIEPTGVDAEALRWARQPGHHAVSVEMANEFPSSRYAALVVWQLLTIHHGSPEQVKEGVDRGFYPGRSSVPDPSSPDGRRTVNAGGNMARWRIEEGERLLRERKDFPYERDVRLSVAVSYAAIGNKEKATEQLNALKSEKGTPESQWAARFLTLQGWQ